MLCDAGGPERIANPGRGGEDPSLRLDEVALADARRRRRRGAADAARERGFEPVFHHHTSTYVESVEEIERFLEDTDVAAAARQRAPARRRRRSAAGAADWGERIERDPLKDVRLDVLAGVKAERARHADRLAARAVLRARRQGDVDLGGFCAASTRAATTAGSSSSRTACSARTSRLRASGGRPGRANRRVAAGARGW